MAPQIERIAENFVLGEGPHWDRDTQSLYFVDIVGQSINRYVPATKKVTTASTGAHVSFIIPIKDRPNTFLITREQELRVITWDGESDKFSVVNQIETNVTLNFNDGKCDPTGRLWTGTVGFKDDVVEVGISSLYAVEKSKVKVVEDRITLSNGIAFNTELKKLYHVDTHKGTIDALDLDIEQGIVKNRQIIFTLNKHGIPGAPDGMAIDVDGNLWVAIFNGSRIIRIDPRKPETLLYTLSLPAQQVTSVAFGGNNLDELYVTSGRIEFGTTEKLLPPENGALYRITGLGVKGYDGEKYVL